MFFQTTYQSENLHMTTHVFPLTLQLKLSTFGLRQTQSASSQGMQKCNKALKCDNSAKIDMPELVCHKDQLSI